MFPEDEDHIPSLQQCQYRQESTEIQWNPIKGILTP